MYDLHDAGIIHYNRSLGWRNVKDKRLLRFSKYFNEIPDGIQISNMVWSDLRTGTPCTTMY